LYGSAERGFIQKILPREVQLLTAPEKLVATVASEGIRDERILEAFRSVPRASFVPAQSADLAYEDVPIRIPRGQVTTQPSLVAKMVEALRIEADDKVLEIGTGYGFQTALLAQLGAFVWSIERFADLAEAARRNLATEAVRNVEVVVGDGTEGLPDQAPFDAILVAAAFPSVPPPLADQLAAGGRIVQPIGVGGADEVVAFVKEGATLARRKMVTGAHFVRLYGAHGFAPDGGD
jgi:protein-L-isoaspartate(D-aspartate) O-methyltransferase